MALTLQHPEDIFDIDPEFSIDVEVTSPIYSEQGSMTYPATLPATLKNRKILKNAQRLDIVTAPDRNTRVVICDGVYRRTGKLNVISAGLKAGITVNVGLDEGEMYALFEDTALSKLNWPVKKYNNAAEAAEQLNKVLREEIDTDYSVFPIKTGGDTVDKTYYPEYLNKLSYNVDISKWEIASDARYENCVNSGSVVKTMVPTGYGCTPFLKVHFILTTIFAHFGYRLVENPFASHPQLKRLVILNNTADALCKGSVKYAELLPSCTVNEFFTALYARTGMVYFVNGAERTVRIKFLKDIVTTRVAKNWKQHLASEPSVTFAEPKRIVLSANTGFEGAEPQKETAQQFLGQYNNKVVENGFIVTASGKPISHDVLNGEAPLFYERRTGRYFEYDYINKSLKLKSTEFFKWDTEDDALEKEEITGVDEFVPMAPVIWEGNECVIPCYLSGYVHRNTVISKGGDEKDNEGETPLAFCFAMPLRDVPYGSIYCYNAIGDQIKDKSNNKFNLSLTFSGENGAFNRFWKEYDAILRHANNTVECEINLPRSELFALDLSAPVLIDGQRMLVESVKYPLPLLPDSPPAVKLRTLKLLKPYNLAAEQEIPISRPWFKWTLHNGMHEYAQGLLEQWAFINKYPLSQCKYEIDTKNYTEFPTGGDFPLKPPLTMADPPVVCFYKMKVKFKWSYVTSQVSFNQYPITARPDYTYYWAADH